MAKDVLIQVTIYDDETGAVVEQMVVNYSGELHWEITRTFEEVGAKVARRVHPEYE